MIRRLLFCLASLALVQSAPAEESTRPHATPGGYDTLIASHAAANGVPESLVRRVIARESGGNARAVSQGNYGLMQIRLGTARAMGYAGSAAGLLDPHTNMTYAVKYLAGAYRAAGGNADRAVMLYARGYRDVAGRQGWDAYSSAASEASSARRASPAADWTHAYNSATPASRRPQRGMRDARQREMTIRQAVTTARTD
jgi:soluble lytic murein transglycosylase-like protein